MADLIETIRKSLSSDKVDPVLKQEFESLLTKNPGVNIGDELIVCFLYIEPGTKVDGTTLAAATPDTVYIAFPYHRLPDVVKNELVYELKSRQTLIGFNSNASDLVNAIYEWGDSLREKKSED